MANNLVLMYEIVKYCEFHPRNHYSTPRNINNLLPLDVQTSRRKLLILMLKAFLANVAATFNSTCIDMAFSLGASLLSEYAVPSIGHPTPDDPVPTETMSDYMVMNPVILNSVANKQEESKNKEEESENEEGGDDVLYQACMYGPINQNT